MFAYAAREVERMREEARKTGGEEAANEVTHATLGMFIGAASAGTTGALIDSAILPGVGTAVGGLVGMVYGAAKGSQDKTALDNVKNAVSLGTKLFTQS